MAHAWEGGIVFILNLLIIDYYCSRCLAGLMLCYLVTVRRRWSVGARRRMDVRHGQRSKIAFIVV